MPRPSLAKLHHHLARVEIDRSLNFLTDNFQKTIQVWAAAATQIFYSLGPAFGGLMTFSSYNEFHNNCYRDAIIVAIINCSTSIFAGFVIFSVIGFMAYSTEQAVDEVATSGVGLLFVAYPEVISQMPISPLWAILFFFMVFTLGLDRQGGIYVVTLMNWYSASFSLMIVSLFEIIAIMYIYGMFRFLEDIKMMIGFKPDYYWYGTWFVITPGIIMFIMIASAVANVPAYYEDYVFPAYAQALGWLMMASSVLMIPGFFLYELLTNKAQSTMWRHKAVSKMAVKYLLGTGVLFTPPKGSSLPHHIQLFCAACNREIQVSPRCRLTNTTFSGHSNFVRYLASDVDSKDDPPETATTNGTKSGKSDKVVKVKKKKPIDYNYTGNVFLLPVRAMHDYLLKPDDLLKVTKYMRRSPYEYGKPITLFLRSDVEKRAIEVWGSLENLNKEKHKKKATLKQHSKYLFNVRMIAEGEKARIEAMAPEPATEQKSFFTRFEVFVTMGSGRVVLLAILVNAVNCALKLIAWIYTGSSSMFSEFVHSVADTLNQVILAFGLYHSIKKPDADHPYGYSNLRYISSLISGVGIFCFGTGLSWYHGIHSFMHPGEFGSLFWAIAVLMGSLVSEGASLLVALNQVRKSANSRNISAVEYVLRGYDPNVNVVLLEDFAAVLGVTVAAACIGITHYTGSPFADSMGSMVIGGLLGGVASFIIYTNTIALVGKSIPWESQHLMSLDLERDRMIRSLHDVKATDMGGEIRFKAEVDFDGREITRAYLYKLDMEQLLQEMQDLTEMEEAEEFMLNHGEKIIDMLGEEVDRIEKILKGRYPDLRHVDLEAL